MCGVQNFLHAGTGLSGQGYLVGFCIRKDAILQHLRHDLIDSMASLMLPLPLVKNCRTNSFGSSAFFF
jgi:K+-transporting ATPase A subunit